MSLQLTPELTATVQSFLAGGRYKNDEEVLREALAALRQQEDDFAEIVAGIEDEAAGRLYSWSEVKGELRAQYGMDD
jgi:putative addiction module CopG family antidote